MQWTDLLECDSGIPGFLCPQWMRHKGKLLNLTESELEAEFNVTFETRLGELCGKGEPTKEQVAIAFQEASEHTRILGSLYVESASLGSSS